MFVNTRIENKIAEIEFFHPAHNSLPSELLSKLTTAIHEAGKDENVSVVILKSAGDRTFCAGASFDELSNIFDIEAGKTFFSGFANVINAMRLCPKFIIVRVQGKVVGGGVGIAAAGDYCLATTNAAIKLSELTIGIGPFVIAPAVERKIGLSAFSELAINAAEWRTAEWAKQKGLYNNVFETTELMDIYLWQLADNLAGSSIAAMAELKKIFWQNTENWSNLLIERATISSTLLVANKNDSLKKSR